MAAAWPARSLAQGGATSQEPSDPLLTLDEALSLALDNNRQVKISALEAQKAEHQVNIVRSRRLPQFHVDALAGSLLQPFDFTFPAGSFGTYPGTGPIPSTDAKITTEAQFTSSVTAAVDQPLSQLYELNLGVKATELGREIAREGLRAERQKVAAQVRSAYFDLVASQAAVDALRETVKTLTEAQRVTAQYEAQQTVLRGRRARGRRAPAQEPVRAAGRREPARDPARGPERPARPRARDSASASSRSRSSQRTR